MENTLGVYNTKENILTWLFWGKKQQQQKSLLLTEGQKPNKINIQTIFFTKHWAKKTTLQHWKKKQTIKTTSYRTLLSVLRKTGLSCSYLKVNLVFKETSKYLRTRLTVQQWLDICSSLEGVLQTASEDGFRKHFWKTSCRHVTRVPSTASGYSKLRRAVQH